MVKSSPNDDWITRGDESYLKPVWCCRDYVAKVREREGGREGGWKGGREHQFYPD